MRGRSEDLGWAAAPSAHSSVRPSVLVVHSTFVDPGCPRLSQASPHHFAGCAVDALRSMAPPPPQATIAADEEHFRLLLLRLLDRFRGVAGSRLLQRRGSLIVRRLSSLLGAQRLFRALSGILEDEAQLRFASAMVQALNLILLTAPEVMQQAALAPCFSIARVTPAPCAAPDDDAFAMPRQER
jgi:Vacuolar protein 14 C-terminal Fig4p binding